MVQLDRQLGRYLPRLFVQVLDSLEVLLWPHLPIKEPLRSTMFLLFGHLKLQFLAQFLRLCLFLPANRVLRLYYLVFVLRSCGRRFVWLVRPLIGTTRHILLA